TEIIPCARKVASMWHYTTQKPSGDWNKPAFNDAVWNQGCGSFGTTGTPGAVVRTKWSSEDIWLRREITLPTTSCTNLQFYVHHDEDVEIYVDGILAASEPGFTTDYVSMEIKPKALELLKPGAKVVLALHCHQTVGGQNVDVALVNVVNPEQ
ncbi:MAG TPA: glutaminase, partial [Verrucomicrobiae bacterium]|nr:glutaminase [Verrucomicrobiae bacterium]